MKNQFSPPSCSIVFPDSYIHKAGEISGNQQKSQEEHLRTILARDKNDPRINAENVAQVLGNEKELKRQLRNVADQTPECYLHCQKYTILFRTHTSRCTPEPLQELAGALTGKTRSVTTDVLRVIVSRKLVLRSAGPLTSRINKSCHFVNFNRDLVHHMVTTV